MLPDLTKFMNDTAMGQSGQRPALLIIAKAFPAYVNQQNRIFPPTLRRNLPGKVHPGAVKQISPVIPHL